MTDKDTPLVDLTFLREFCRDDREKMANYIHMFLESAPEQMEDIKSKAGQGNWNAVKAAAHALKPQVKFMGLAAIQPIIEQIESDTHADSSLASILPLISHLERLLERSSNELIQTLVSLA
jgi:HPt (histidine-containing phosphotransfer) domain-containing protein